MILLDPRDRRPLYEQIIEKLSELMAFGVLSRDEPLPSVRNLAARLSINPNTVQRAYLELERQGFIYSVKGKGSFVSDPAEIREKKRALFRSELENVIKKGAALSLTEEEMMSETARLCRLYAAGPPPDRNENPGQEDSETKEARND